MKVDVFKFLSYKLSVIVFLQSIIFSMLIFFISCMYYIVSEFVTYLGFTANATFNLWKHCIIILY